MTCVESFVTRMSSVSLGGIVSVMDDPDLAEKVLKSLESASCVEFGNSNFRKLVLFSKEADIFTFNIKKVLNFNFPFLKQFFFFFFLLAVDQSETKIQISGAIHLVNLRTPLKVYLIPLFMIILVPLDKVRNL